MKTKYNIFYILFCLVAFCGCTTEDDYSSPMPDTTGKEAYVAFDLAVPGQEFPTATTRTIADDAAINEYVIWIFQNNKFVKEIKSSESGKVVIRGKQLFLLLPESSSPVTLCMIANSTVTAPTVGTEKQAALEKVEVTIGNDYKSQPNYMPMYGESSLSEVKLGVKSEITLRRSMAKVELIISANAYEKFQLQDIKLLNINNKGYVCVEKVYSTGRTDYTYSDVIYVDKEIKFSCYIPEIADVNGSKRVSLLLNGTYGDGKSTFYRLDFIAKDGNKIEDIKRNYRYTYVINNIKASGFTTEKDAIDAEIASNGDTERIEGDWTFMDEDIMDITTDGTYYLGVTSAKIVAGSETNDEYYYANFSVVCNNTTEGWKMITSELPVGTTVSLEKYTPKDDEIMKAISIWVYIEKTKVTQGDTVAIYIYTGNIRKKIEVIIPITK